MAKKRASNSSVKVSIYPKNEEQKDMLRIISEKVITFVKGAPGTGKTYLAVSYALKSLLKKECEKIVFTRPVVEAGGEKLGFLPGNFHEKIDPYMIPIFETLSKLMSPEVLREYMPKNGNGNGNESKYPIRVLPLAYMRGLTFDNTFVICDEMQNSTPEQVRMITTRLGKDSRMIICGDVYQSDIKKTNGLHDAFDLLQDIDGIGFVTLSQAAIVRHPIIQDIEAKYLTRDLSTNHRMLYNYNKERTCAEN